MFTPQPLDLNELRKLAGLPAEESDAQVEEGIKDKVGDTPNLPGPSGGDDALLDEEGEDEDEDETAVEEDATQPETEAQAGEEEVSEGTAPLGEHGEEVAEAVEGELNNGYKKHHTVKDDDHFPTGQDQSVSDEAGPSSAHQGDNPMQKKTKVRVEEAKGIHHGLVYAYRDFIKEDETSSKQATMDALNTEHIALKKNLRDAKARGDEHAIASLQSRLANNERKLEHLGLGSR
jgi:hypothetical protein